MRLFWVFRCCWHSRCVLRRGGSISKFFGRIRFCDNEWSDSATSPMIPSRQWLVRYMTACPTRSSRCFNTVSNENHLQENTTRPSDAFQSNRNSNTGTHRGVECALVQRRARTHGPTQSCFSLPFSFLASQARAIGLPVPLCTVLPTVLGVRSVQTSSAQSCLTVSMVLNDAPHFNVRCVRCCQE